MNIMESLTDDQAPIRPASNITDDGTYIHFWIGSIGQGMEDVVLMNDQTCAELNALIEANKISIARKRYVRAAGKVLCFWQLNSKASSAYEDGLDSLIDDTDIEKPF